MISPELNMSDYGDEDPANRLERLGFLCCCLIAR